MFLEATDKSLKTEQKETNTDRADCLYYLKSARHLQSYVEIP